jgi:pSer/pThr/pTyr-binding forkhead associated (FHA) protein
MDKCPTCGADTRPGDNFCLNCGNRLTVSTPSAQQAQPGMGVSGTDTAMATLADDGGWMPVTPPTAPASPWNDPDLLTVASTSAESPTLRAENPVPAVQAVMHKIDNPARLILRSDSGEILQEYILDKAEMSIGRAPNSDILLSKDKLTSRRHATILYLNGIYSIQDERSANGTFVNSQQLDQVTPRQLNDNDQIGIGEHELTFRSTATTSSIPDIDSLPTVMVRPSTIGELTYRTRDDEMLTAATSDEFGTRSMNGGSESTPFTPPSESASAPAEPAPVPEPAAPAADIAPPPPGISMSAPATSSAGIASPPPISPDSGGVNFSRLTSLQQPILPDVAPLMAALTALDGQVASLQEQLNATQDALRTHQADIAQTTNQLRSGVRSVSDRMDKTIADVARNREQLAWAELSQLMEDVMNNPRDIEYVTKLARKARELNKVFQIHQNVLNTLAECTSLLRSLIGEDR